jgi:glycosyltransferase involved in cell wall biosynthesis
MAGRIGVIVHRFPKLSQTFIAQEVRLLEERGLELEILARRVWKRDLGDPIVSGIRAPLQSLPGPRKARFWWGNLSALAHRPLGYVGTLARAARDARRFPDRRRLQRFLEAGWLVGARRAGRPGGLRHVHCHFFGPSAEVGAYAARIAGIGCTLVAHPSPDIYTSSPELLRDLVGAAEAVMTCTANSAAYLRSQPGVDPGRIHVVYHGIDTRRFSPAETAAPSAVAQLVAVAQFIPKKGYACLFRAVSLLERAGVRFRFRVFGKGPLEGELHQLVTSLGLDDYVEFCGQVSSDEVARALSSCDLFLCGSRQSEEGDRDGIPNSLAEAMAAGVPVVATRVAGIPELVEDGISGVLVAPDDPQALYEAAAKLLHDRSQARRVGEGARRRVLDFFDSRTRIEDCERLLLSSLRPPARPDQSYVARDPSSPGTS